MKRKEKQGQDGKKEARKRGGRERIECLNVVVVLICAIYQYSQQDPVNRSLVFETFFWFCISSNIYSMGTLDECSKGNLFTSFWPLSPSLSVCFPLSLCVSLFLFLSLSLSFTWP